MPYGDTVRHSSYLIALFAAKSQVSSLNVCPFSHVPLAAAIWPGLEPQILGTLLR